MSRQPTALENAAPDGPGVRPTETRIRGKDAYVRRLLARLDGIDLHPAPKSPGRNRWTVCVDAALEMLRRYAPPVHWIVSAASALALFVYVQVVAWTARVTVTPPGCLTAPSVLAVWHGGAPSLLGAIRAMRPRPPLAILVAPDARGDMLALFCRLLGLRVVRGSRHDAGKAIAALSAQLDAGTGVILTADGGGPARVAKAGPVALAAAAGVPLVPVGTDCRPSLTESHKWDRARNPVPFGRIAVNARPPLHVVIRNAADFQDHRRRLATGLDEAVGAARRALDSNHGS